VTSRRGRFAGPLRPLRVGLLLSGVALSACALRGPLTDTFGFMPKPMRDGRETPRQWGWDTARLDTISRVDSAGGVLAWWGDARGPQPTCGGVLLLHGKGKNRADMLTLAQSLQQAGFAVLIPDYRGYGGSVGEPTTAGVFDDASLAYRSLRARLGDSTLPIAIIGHSMGTALAARLARQHAPVATVYITPFTRISRLVRAKAGAIGPRLFDTTAFAFNPVEDASVASGRSMVVVAGRDMLINRSVSADFVAALAPAPVVLTDEKASHMSVLTSPVVVRTVTDSVRAWSGCSGRLSALQPTAPRFAASPPHAPS
jgi:fermentation-respiration switch protein FrsA (DUF1100 family)